jgi:hypothetical protein
LGELKEEMREFIEEFDIEMDYLANKASFETSYK